MFLYWGEALPRNAFTLGALMFLYWDQVLPQIVFTLGTPVFLYWDQALCFGTSGPVHTVHNWMCIEGASNPVFLEFESMCVGVRTSISIMNTHARTHTKNVPTRVATWSLLIGNGCGRSLLMAFFSPG